MGTWTYCHTLAEIAGMRARYVGGEVAPDVDSAAPLPTAATMTVADGRVPEKMEYMM